MLCCGNCFNDNYLSREIIRRSTQQGTCSFCHSENTHLITPNTLLDYFEPLLNVYAPSEDPKARHIEALLRQDWGIFSLLTPTHAHQLTEAVFSETSIASQKYIPLIPHDGTLESQWEAFREELKHRNRFFPKNVPEEDLLGKLVGYLNAHRSALVTTVYRARTLERVVPYSVAEMGKPPENIVSHGRANPFGIPYLYAASDITTAIAEIRPHTGGAVCVAAFKMDANARIADLRDPRATVSPFELSEEDDIQMLHRYMGYLCRLGDELSKPILPKEAHLEYLPSQYLCEFIKHCGYDGVIYKSSVASGVNYAMFNESKLSATDVKQYKINSITVDYE